MALCSPETAARKSVNEEFRAFAKANGVERIFPDDPRLRREHGDLMIQFSHPYERTGDAKRWKEAADEAKRIFAALA